MRMTVLSRRLFKRLRPDRILRIYPKHVPLQWWRCCCWWGCYLLLMTRSAVTISASSLSTDERYLYYAQDVDTSPVIEYMPDADATDPNHPDFLYRPQAHGPRIVEFYAHWCPHCRRFRDHYVQFAGQLVAMAKDQKVEPPLRVYAISCVAHKAICRDQGVKGYPSLKVFPAYSLNATAEPSYFRLHPFSVLGSMGINFDVDNHAQFAVADTSMTADSTAVTSHTHSSFLRRNWFGSLTSTTDGTLRERQTHVADLDSTRRTKQNVFDDAYRSFDFAIRTAVFMTNGPLEHNATRDALHDWLSLLQKATPPTWSTLQKPVRALLGNFDEIVRGEDHLLAVYEKVASPPASHQWSDDCSHGQKGAGYTCGLWQLFHIVTVGATEWNLMLLEENSPNLLDLTDTADTFRNYVQHFFGCEVCRLNFVSAYDACAHDRCHRLDPTDQSRTAWIQLPLWLFETHNAVNARLLREQAEREGWNVTLADQRAREFPSRHACPVCWKADGSWDEDMVYQFLRLEYWPEDSVAVDLREQLAQRIRVQQEGWDSQRDPNDPDDDRNVPVPPVALQLVPLMVVVGLVAAWYTKRNERLRTGRHKRIA